VHAGGRIANVLAPTGVKLFVHYYERETKNQEKVSIARKEVEEKGLNCINRENHTLK
jgi:hypothetical protein